MGIVLMQAKAIEKALRRPVDHHVLTHIDGEILNQEEGNVMQEEQEVQKATFLLRLLKL